MDDILQAIKTINANEELEDMQESTASFPSEDLPLDIWDKTQDGYILKPELKENIIEALKQYPNVPLLDIAESIKIVGSIGTNLYDEDADIDIHIEPKAEALEGKSEEELAELQRDIMKWFKDNRDEYGWYVNAHPYEVYFQLNPASDYFSDTVYDLLTDEWIKVPKKYAMDYNPYTAYGDIFTEIDEFLAPVDVLIGKLHRSIKDVAKLKTAGDSLKASKEELLEQASESIRKTILELDKVKAGLHEIRSRNQAELPDELPEDPEELQLSDKWKRDNTVFKFIGSIYGYKELVSKLSKLLDDQDQLLPDAIDKIPAILSEFYGV